LSCEWWYSLDCTVQATHTTSKGEEEHPQLGIGSGTPYKRIVQATNT